jgi:hypothetical protein
MSQSGHHTTAPWTLTRAYIEWRISIAFGPQSLLNKFSKAVLDVVIQEWKYKAYALDTEGQ